MGLRSAYDDLNQTALSGDQLSEATRIVLRRAALLEVFDYRPDDAITALRAQAIITGMDLGIPRPIPEGIVAPLELEDACGSGRGDSLRNS